MQDGNGTPTSGKCPLCENQQGNCAYSATEKMFGLGGEFTYLECRSCKALSLQNAPRDLSPYYPADYYSFSNHGAEGGLKYKLVGRVISAVIAHRSGQGNVIGKFLAEKTRKFEWVVPGLFQKDSAILDVGCGGGRMLRILKQAGFTNLTGADPFIDDDIDFGPGMRIHKKALNQMIGKFDFIMMSHTFEHLADPFESLKELALHLKPEGQVLIRIPIADCSAWREYGSNWVQLDAPRHIHLHTEKSIRLLAKKASMKVERVIYDSTSFQFIGSEKYKRGQPLDSDASFLSYEQLRSFERKAADLNGRKEGDTASFYISHG